MATTLALAGRTRNRNERLSGYLPNSRKVAGLVGRVTARLGPLGTGCREGSEGPCAGELPPRRATRVRWQRRAGREVPGERLWLLGKGCLYRVIDTAKSACWNCY